MAEQDICIFTEKNLFNMVDPMAVMAAEGAM
jgi:hypothetical protein